jgi:DNA repair protein RecO (recombination protein O)
MSASLQRVDLAGGYLLHQRPYRDTSLIVDIFTRDHGRLTTFARGVRGARGRSTRFSSLRPFQRLLLSWHGRGEAPRLIAAEADGAGAALPSANLMSGFYVNELLLKLTTTHDPHPDLFALYENTLQALAAPAHEQAPESALRRFERQLLELIGFGLDLTSDAGTGAAVCDGGYYGYLPGEGVRERSADDDGVFRGSLLLALAGDAPLSDADRRDARRLMRTAIDHCLEGRELNTRTVARSIARMEQASAGAAS